MSQNNCFALLCVTQYMLIFRIWNLIKFILINVNQNYSTRVETTKVTIFLNAFSTAYLEGAEVVHVKYS
jgi:hypothetical protein